MTFRSNAGSSFSPAMHEWARRHASRLADQFMREARCDRDDPRAYFERHCGTAGLTPELRATAEPTYMARLVELESGRG